jgi:hypothetical protein
MPPNPHLDNLPDTADPVMDVVPFEFNSVWEFTTTEIEPHPAGERQPFFYGKRRLPYHVYTMILKPRWHISVMRRVIHLAKRMLFHTGTGLGDPEGMLDEWEPWTYILEMDMYGFGKVNKERPDEINLAARVSQATVSFDREVVHADQQFIEDAAWLFHSWEQNGNEEISRGYKRDLFFIAAIIALQPQYSLRFLPVSTTVSLRC